MNFISEFESLFFKTKLLACLYLVFFCEDEYFWERTMCKSHSNEAILKSVHMELITDYVCKSYQASYFSSISKGECSTSFQFELSIDVLCK